MTSVGGKLFFNTSNVLDETLPTIITPCQDDSSEETPEQELNTWFRKLAVVLILMCRFKITI